MNLKLSSHKGGILLLTMLFMVSLVVFASIYLSTVINNNNNAMSQINNTKALYIAEAGLNKAVYYLQNNTIASPWRTNNNGHVYPDGSPNDPANPCTATPTDPCAENFSSGIYTIWVDDGTGSNVKITSQGVFNGNTRTVQAQTIANGHAFIGGTWKEL